MRKQDINVGDEYAVVEYEGSRAQRVRVESFGHARHVYSKGRDFRGHTVHDGVLVTSLDRETGEVLFDTKVERSEPTEEQVRIARSIGAKPVVTEVEHKVPRQFITITRNIVRTWDAEVLRQHSAAAMEADKQTRIDTLKAKLDEVNAALKDAGLADTDLHFKWNDRTHSVQYGVVEIGVHLLDRLIKRGDDK